MRFIYSLHRIQGSEGIKTRVGILNSDNKMTSRRSMNSDHLIRQVMSAMIQDHPFDFTRIISSHFRGWTDDSILSTLASIPHYFFLQPRFIGRQSTSSRRHRRPLKQMPKSHTTPNPNISFGVEKALKFYKWVEIQCGFLHSESTCREMCRVLAKSDQLQILWGFLRENESNITTSTVTAIIKVLGELGRGREALAAFYRMKQLHCKPDVQAYNVVISALCRVGKMKRVRLLLEQMELPGFHCPPDKYTYTILIDAYCKRGLQTGCRKAIRRRIWEANHMFRRMIFNGFSPDVVTYNCLINGLCKTYRIDRALELFDEMRKKNCYPNRVTYTSFIRYYSAVNEIEKAVEMMRVMAREKHGSATTSCYTPIIHALCEDGRTREAKELTEEMVSRGFIPREFTYNLIRHALAGEGGEDLSRSIESGMEARYKRTLHTRPLMRNTSNSIET